MSEPVKVFRAAAVTATLFAVVVVGLVRPVEAVLILNEDFSTDPITAGRAVPVGDANSTPGSRFDYSSGKVTAHYDSGQDAALLRWSLDRPVPLTTANDFRFEVDFRILSAGFVAQANANPFAQLSFGLASETTTGLNRLTDARDIAMVDYFPAESTVFDGLPALGPVMTRSNGDFFSGIEYPFDAEAGLDDVSLAGEPDELPPLDVPLTAIYDFDASARRMTLQIDSPGGLLEINQIGEGDVPGTSDIGGDDDNVTTIRHQLPPGFPLSVDSFALALWDFGSSTLVADIEFSRVAVWGDLVGLPPLGDMNGDGAVDQNDSPLFIQALVDRDAFDAAFPLVDADFVGDINENGQLDLGDVAPFGDLLGESSAAAQVPEPPAGVLIVSAVSFFLRRRYRTSNGTADERR
jgi:hypothetical protein